ncbi:MAG: DUF4968 domain-containing protein [Lachnospiraceae bacterium]|nr:DUF4968 domain-containing protein [Lachnospiraceae bacterium]
MLTAISPKSMTITKTARLGDSLVLESEACTTKITPVSENIVKISCAPEGKFSDMERPGVICTERCHEWEFSEDGSVVTMKLPDLTVAVSKISGSLTFLDGNGRILLKEKEETAREFEEFETYRLGDRLQTRIIETADGKKEVLEDPERLPAGKSFHVRYHFVPGDEDFYGFGQQEKGFGSLRGRKLYVHQGNRKIAVPMFVSTSGYGLLTDTYSPLVFNDDENGAYIYVESDKELVQYFVAGSMNEVIAGYRHLTGKASLLPKWAYGYVQSQERYESQEEILEAVAKSREMGLGMDCIVLDWISWKDGEWGQKSYDPSRFPDPKAMIDTLHENHVHFMISIWPTMAGGTENNKEFAEKGLLLPANTAYNALDKDARNLYFDQLRRTHFSYGTDAWWCDSSEPFTPEWGHRIRMEEGDQYRAFCEEAGLRMPYDYCNSYPLFHAMGIYENQRRAMDEDRSFPEKRVCNLTRSAYTGQQRFGTVMWSGDTGASWDTYRDQIAIGLHFSASGLPYWTNDIGAFFVKRGEFWYWDGKYDDALSNKGYQELYVRWYQYAAFLPMFRAHGTDCRREMWNFEGEFFDALDKSNKLRYSLMPYIYSEAGKVWLEDRSLIRWLAFDFTDDIKCRNITDQYMLGGSLMVCPVTQPMYYDDDGKALREIPKTRKVYFPAGHKWHDLYSGKTYEGGSTHEVDAPLDTIPVFVMDGSIIPMTAPTLSTEELSGDIEFRKFASGPSSYDMYEDSGDGYGYENGEYTIKRINLV